jgi:GH15 family glucan-1,4-alpha-glucosidase
MTSTIQDYAIIGDGRSCALVARTGSIDFLCWPRFDSDACLMALLGDERHGFWLISPAGYVSDTTRCYRGDTPILETEHVTETGRVRVTDLMPWRDGPSSIIRIVEGLEGEVQMAMSLRLRFGYGEVVPWAQCNERGAIFEVGPDRLVLDCTVGLTIVHFRFFLHISLRKSARDDLQLMLFSALIVILMVSGTLIILFNLRARMM